MIPEENFWILWCPEGPTPPQVKHKSYQAAHKAGMEMAEKHLKPFYILEALSKCEARVEVTKTTLRKRRS